MNPKKGAAAGFFILGDVVVMEKLMTFLEERELCCCFSCILQASSTKIKENIVGVKTSAIELQGAGIGRVCYEGKDGAEGAILAVTGGSEDHGMLEWKDACVEVQSTACGHRKERNEEYA